MKKCVICRNDILNEDPAIFFEGTDGVQKEICKSCEEKIDIMMENDNVQEAKSATNYLYTCYLSNTDEEVKKVIKKSLEENSKKIVYKEKEIAGQNPVDSTNIVDYFNDYINDEHTDVSKWISILNVTVWIYVIIFSILAIVVTFTLGLAGIAYIISLSIVFLMLLSIVKIVTNMSIEITEIRKMLIKRNK